MMVVLGDFNAKLTFAKSKIYILTSSFGFNQIINELTHILNNSSSCIDLIFTSQPNLVAESGVPLSTQIVIIK